MLRKTGALSALLLLAACGGEDLEASTVMDELGIDQSTAGLVSVEAVRVKSLTTGDEIPRSRALLLRATSFGVAGTIKSYGLPEGHVILASWAIFNNPSACTVGNPATGAMCGPGDLGNPAAGASVQFMDSAVIRHHSGKFRTAAALPLNDTSNCYQAPPPCGSGLTVAHGSEVHMVLRDKGPVIPERFEEQSTTFFGGCDVYPCALLQAGQFIP